MLKNKKILIAGLANKHSIAAGIARAMHAQGAELAFTYQSERLKRNVEKIASELNSDLSNFLNQKSNQSVFCKLSKKHPPLKNIKIRPYKTIIFVSQNDPSFP